MDAIVGKRFGARRRPRSGFVMWTVLATLLVMGILVGGLSFMSRSQNAQAHRVNFGEVASQLADAGLELAGRRVRDALFTHPFQRQGYSVVMDGSFWSVFLLDNARLKQIFDTGAGSGERFLEKLLGRNYRYTLDLLLGQLPGSSLKLTLSVEPQPLVPNPIVADPVEKRVRFVLRAQADYRGVTRVEETGYEVKVVHPFPPVTSKFTLFVHDSDTGESYNTYRNGSDGNPYTPADFPPVVLNNTPSEEYPDLDSFNQGLIRDNLPNERTPGDGPGTFLQMPLIRDALDRRGWVYLGSGSGSSEIHLNMTAGPVLLGKLGFGEHYHFFDPLPPSIGGMDGRPGYFRVEPGASPPFFNAPIPDPQHLRADGSPLMQAAMINFLYFGFHYPDASSNMRDGTLGKSLATESSSVLHLFGSNAIPSRTKVFGNVFSDYARYGYLAVDRDATSDDENFQNDRLQAAGLPPVLGTRDTGVPAFNYADSQQWNDDLNRESSGQPMTALATIPAQVPNLNFMRGPVVVDPGWPTVPLDPASYRYARMFGAAYDSNDPDPAKNHGYSRYMSQIVATPYVDMLDFMFYTGVIPPQDNPSFREPTLKEGHTYYQQADQVTMQFHDPLHDQLGMRTYFQGALADVFKRGGDDYGMLVGSPPPPGSPPPQPPSTGLPQTSPLTAPALRSGLLPPPVKTPSPAAAMLLARTYREFVTAQDLFKELLDPSRNVLFLRQCVRIRSGDLVLPANLTYSGSGAIVVMDGSITVNGLRAATAFDNLTLATLNGDLNVGPGSQGAALVACAGSVNRSASTTGAAPLVTNGTLAALKLPAANLTTGGVLAYRGVYDPMTDLRDPAGSAYIDYYQMALSDVPMDWKRVAPLP